MRYAKLLTGIFSLIFLFSACTEPTAMKDGELQIEGEVTYKTIEGGFWAIQDQDQTYEPINLSEDYQQEGLKVQVSANEAKDMASVHMVGPIIEIVSIRKR